MEHLRDGSRGADIWLSFLIFDTRSLEASKATYKRS
jgi:hypothetical protein